MNEPLAIYSESQIGLKRDFALYADRVVIKQRKAGTITEIPIMLADLRPLVSKFWGRHWTFRVGRGLLLVSAIPWLLFAILALTHEPGDAVAFSLAIALLFDLVGGIICWRTFRRVEWTQYHNHFGQVWLNVARAGSQCDRYDAFIESLELQIMAAQRTTIQARP